MEISIFSHILYGMIVVFYMVLCDYGIMIYSIYIIIHIMNVWDLNQINGLYDYVSSRVFRLYNSC
jgi:hypothetical protein